jgi:hypothetical protein
MKKISEAVLTIACMMLASGCSGSTTGDSAIAHTGEPISESSATDSAAPRTTIPSDFFGMNVVAPGDFPLQVPYGQYRTWDARGAQWPEVETCRAASGNSADPCFDWSGLDAVLGSVKSAGLDDVMYTLSRTPPWAVTAAQADDSNCNYYVLGPASHGACYPPIDLAADGSGPNEIWKNWVTAIASHVNAPSYRAGHAHVHIWEPWNEWYRSSIVGAWTGPMSFQGTYAQMVRITEDLRCIVTGKGAIHNDPKAGDVSTCTSVPIDPTALITTPSGSLEEEGRGVMQNFLYCNANPPPGSICTTGNAGSLAVDIINYHMYPVTETPEAMSTQVDRASAFLVGADRSKPLMDGEGSWGEVPSRGGGSIWQNDSYARAGFIPRYFALNWSAGVRHVMWYSYDTITGDLFDSATRSLLKPEAIAWNQTFAWLAGATPLHTPLCAESGTVYTCDLRRSNGKTGRLVWDSKYGQGCSSMPDPIVCGSTSYAVPASFDQGWRALDGVEHAPAAMVTIGANPILLEGG